MKYTITPLGGAGRALGRIVDAIVRYLQPRTPEPTGAAVGDSRGDGAACPARYYADSGEEPGRWRGRGARTLALTG